MEKSLEQHLIAMGMQVQAARKKGGKTVFEKYGSGHFAELGRKSAEKKKLLKNEANSAC